MYSNYALNNIHISMMHFFEKIVSTKIKKLFLNTIHPYWDIFTHNSSSFLLEKGFIRDFFCLKTISTCIGQLIFELSCDVSRNKLFFAFTSPVRGNFNLITSLIFQKKWKKGIYFSIRTNLLWFCHFDEVAITLAFFL